MKAIIYRAESGGLANRLRALIGYQAMSYFLDVPFYLYWVPNVYCDTDFAHLFDATKIKVINPTELNKLKVDNEISILDKLYWFDRIWKINLENTVPWLDFLKQATFHLGNLNPQHHIAEKLDYLSKQYDVYNALGIHIRWTDNIKSYKGWANRNIDFNPNYVSNLDGFQNFIENQITKKSNVRIFLATDNIAIERKLKKLYPNNIIVYPKKYRREKLTFSLLDFRFKSFQRASSIEDALIEMLLLSRCRMILGTYYSSYSKFSAVWGNIDYFEVRGSEYARNDFVDSLRSDNHRKSQ
jgi:hypothetical protein